MTDYAACNKAFAKQKAALTRAQKKGREAVLFECMKAVEQWSEAPFNGMWPDDWSRWQRALDDAFGWRNTHRLDDFR
jgi:hypothetical protein